MNLVVSRRRIVFVLAPLDEALVRRIVRWRRDPPSFVIARWGLVVWRWTQPSLPCSIADSTSLAVCARLGSPSLLAVLA